MLSPLRTSKAWTQPAPPGALSRNLHQPSPPHPPHGPLPSSQAQSLTFFSNSRLLQTIGEEKSVWNFKPLSIVGSACNRGRRKAGIDSPSSVPAPGVGARGGVSDQGPGLLPAVTSLQARRYCSPSSSRRATARWAHTQDSLPLLTTHRVPGLVQSAWNACHLPSRSRSASCILLMEETKAQSVQGTCPKHVYTRSV